MDTLSPIFLWIGIVAFALAILSIPLYYRRFFDPQGGKRALKSSTILLSIGVLFMFFSIYAKGDLNLETALICSLGFILLLVISYIFQLSISNVTGKMMGSYLQKLPEDDELFPIDKLKNSIKVFFNKFRNGKKGGND
jgi:hypothetical protein